MCGVILKAVSTLVMTANSLVKDFLLLKLKEIYAVMVWVEVRLKICDLFSNIQIGICNCFRKEGRHLSSSFFGNFVL